MPDEAPETGTEDAPEDGTDDTGDDAGSTDSAAEVEKWKALARKQEARAKANASAAKELDELKRKQMSDADRIKAEARDEGLAAGRAELVGDLVQAEFRAASAGRSTDIDALTEHLDPSKFLGEDGRPDRTAITAFVDKVAPKGQADIGQGERGSRTGKATDMNGLIRQLARPGQQ